MAIFKPLRLRQLHAEASAIQRVCLSVKDVIHKAEKLYFSGKQVIFPSLMTHES